MRASKADKFYMGMLLAIICFCFGLLRIMDEADARRAAERETLNVAEPPAIVAPAFQPVQTVYFEPDPEPEEPAAEVFAFREDVPLSAELQEVLWDACQEHKVEYALVLGLIETESSFDPEAVSYRRQWPVYPGLWRAEVRQQGHGDRRRDDRRRDRRDRKHRRGHLQGGRHRELHRREALHQRKRGHRHGL